MIHLYATQQYGVSPATQRAEWPALLDTKIRGQRQSYQLLQNPVFMVKKPRFMSASLRPSRTWSTFGNLVTAEPAQADLASDRSCCLVYENFAFPLSVLGPMVNEDMQALGQAFGEDVEQSGRNQSSYEQFGADAKKTAMLLLSTVTLLVALIIGIFIFMDRFVSTEVGPAVRVIAAFGRFI